MLNLVARRKLLLDLRRGLFNPLTPNDLKRRHAVSHLKIKVPSKNSRQAALRGGI
jgi:hypothetical protein